MKLVFHFNSLQPENGGDDESRSLCRICECGHLAVVPGVPSRGAICHERLAVSDVWLGSSCGSSAYLGIWGKVFLLNSWGEIKNYYLEDSGRGSGEAA
jgi:hypothetical protein